MFSVTCDRKGPLFTSSTIWYAKLAPSPTYSISVGMSFTINYSSVRMKWAAEKEAAMPDSSWNVSSRDCAFNISDVWAAHTVYVTACSLAPLKATAALSFKPLLKPVIVDWSNFFLSFFILRFDPFHSNTWRNQLVFRKSEVKVLSYQVLL